MSVNSYAQLMSAWSGSLLGPSGDVVVALTPDSGVTASGKCSICMEHFRPKDTTNTLQCSHRFHHGCLSCWVQIRPSCPLCRRSIGMISRSHTEQSS